MITFKPLLKRIAVASTFATAAMAGSPALAIVAIRCEEFPGLCQTFPVFPGLVNGPVWTFINPQSGLWFDPPTAISFDIEVFGTGALVTRIGAPLGFQDLVIKVADSPVNTDFDAGQFHTFTPGVMKFNISGFSVDSANTAAFPLYMEFSGTVASMTWTAQMAPVPEAGTYALMSIGLAGVLTATRRRRADSTH